eukprot:TRINITY_DN38142_c0_g1_i1.p1 TRINITY_DN38142_c0_g1~~TRINITY_DN38142_c0_g1_i1.p1  ORF type:complete len:610 (+),score=107.47 TRINITY_DN38142_c0_g1_i1:91-1920(+)
MQFVPSLCGVAAPSGAACAVADRPCRVIRRAAEEAPEAEEVRTPGDHARLQRLQQHRHKSALLRSLQGRSQSERGSREHRQQVRAAADELLQKRLICLPQEYTILVSSLGASEQWRSALAVLERGRQRGAELGRITSNAALNACKGTEAWNTAVASMGGMLRRQLELDLDAYNMAMSAYSGGSQWRAGLSLAAGLADFSLQRDIISWGSAMSACKHGWRWRTAVDIVELMRSGRTEPDMVICKAAISCCHKARRRDVGDALLREMQGRTLRADAVAYVGALGVKLRSRLWHEGLISIEQLGHKHVPPSQVLCGTIASACQQPAPKGLRGKVEQQQEYECGSSSVLNPIGRTYRLPWECGLALLQRSWPADPAAAPAAGSSWQSGLVTAAELHKGDLEVISRTLQSEYRLLWSAVACTCTREANWQAAEEVFESFRRTGVRITDVAYSAIVAASSKAAGERTAAADAGAWQRAVVHLLQTSAAAGFDVRSLSYDASREALSACRVAARNTEEATHADLWEVACCLLGQIQTDASSSISELGAAYEDAIHTCRHLFRHDEASHLVDEMTLLGLTPPGAAIFEQGSGADVSMPLPLPTPRSSKASSRDEVYF